MGLQPVEPREQVRDRFLAFRQPRVDRVHLELDGSVGGPNKTGEPFAPTSGYEVKSSGGFVLSSNSELSNSLGSMTGSKDMTSQKSGRRRILLLEDNIADAKLSLRELARAGFEVDSEVVSTSKEFIERLHSQQYDLLLADYRLPDWTGLDALRWLRSSGIDVPFILVTGTLGDDLAVECIKEGATDYVLKDKLDRLPRACQRALEEKQLRLERDRAENELRESEQQYRLLFDTNPLPMWVFDRETVAFLAVNEAAVRHYGFSRQEFFAMTIKDIRPEEDIPVLLQAISQPRGGLNSPEVWRHRKKDGTVIDVEVTSHALPFRGRQAELVLAHDVTDQKRNQERLKQ